MPDDFDRQPETEKAAAADSAEADAKPAPEADPLAAAQGRIADLEAELETMRAEVEKNRDLWMRERAEAENFKKRLQRDKADSIRFANEGLIRQLLEILDNLERAVEHAGLGGNGKSLAEGVEMVVQMFHGMLSTHGVARIDASVGAPFDPNVHDALASEPRDDFPPNTVIREELSGYRCHDRLLRAARVVVSAVQSPRGGDGEAPEEEEGS